MTVADRAYVEIAPLFEGFTEKVQAGIRKGFVGVGPLVAAEGRKAGLEYSRGMAAGVRAGNSRVLGTVRSQARAASAAGASAGRSGGEGFAKSFITGLGGAKLFTGFAAAAGIVIGLGAKMAGDFQAQMTRLVTAAGEVPSAIGMVSRGVLQISRDTGTSTKQLSASMYMVESAGFHGARALEIVRASAEGAKVDLADAAVVGNALTTAMNDLGKGAGPAATIMSQLVATVGRGKMTMDDLASSLHSVLPNAAALGLGIAQVGGAIATMTAQGISAQQATQNLNHAILSLANPTAVQTKAMAAFGLNSSEVARALGKRGLAGTLQEISTAITKHMGPAGLTITNAFNTSQIAAGKAKTAYGALPPVLQSYADKIKSGALSLGVLRGTTTHLTLAQKTQLQQWAQLQRTASGFSDLLKQGSPSALTYAAALSKMTGGQVGLQVALHLTGQNMPAYLANIKAIGKAHAEGGGHVEGWAAKQATFNQKMSQLKQVVMTAVIALGTYMLPVLTQIADFILTRVVPAIAIIGHFLKQYLGPTTVLLFTLLGKAVRTLYVVLADTFNFVSAHQKTFAIIAVVITTLVLPAIISLAVTTATSLGTTIALWIMYRTEATLAGIRTVAAFVMTQVAGFSAAASAVGTFAVMVGGWVLLGVQSLVNAAKIAAAWVIAMGPIGWAIAAIVTITTLVILNWKKIEQWTAKIWKSVSSWIVDSFHTVLNFMKKWGPLALAVLMPFIGIPLLIYQHWGELTSFFSRLFTGIGNFLFHWRHVIADVLLWFIYIPIMIVKHWSSIVGFFKSIWNSVINAVKDGISAALDFVAKLPGRLLRIFTGAGSWLLKQGRAILNGLGNGLAAGWTSVNQFVAALPGRIKRFFLGAVSWLLSAGRSILSGLLNGISRGWSATSAFVGSLPGRIKRFFTGSINWLLGAGRNILNGLLSGIQRAWTSVSRWIFGLRGRVVGLVKNASSWLLHAGSDILTGMWNGLKRIWNNVIGWFKSLPGKILSVLGIHSPPDWAVDAGMHMMKGILKGIIEHAGGPIAFMGRWSAQMAKKALGAAKNLIIGGKTVVPGLGGGNMLAAAQAIKLTGVPMSWLPAILRRIQFESGGNPGAINLTDANAKRGTPSKGLMQVIDPTFRSYQLPGHGNIWNPVDNIAAAIRYIQSRYGSIFSIDPPVQGYAAGAWDVARDQLAYLHKREMVVPAKHADKIRQGQNTPVAAQPAGPLIAKIDEQALANALSKLTFQFDSDGLARLVSRKQQAIDVKGVRR